MLRSAESVLKQKNRMHRISANNQVDFTFVRTQTRSYFNRLKKASHSLLLFLVFIVPAQRRYRYHLVVVS